MKKKHLQKHYIKATQQILIFMAYKMQSLPATHSEMTDVHLEKKFKLGIYSFIFQFTVLMR